MIKLYRKQIDESTNDSWPKTLLIQNTLDGLVWQVYHVNNELEVSILSENAWNNDFEVQKLIDFDDFHYKETWPGWRDTEGWYRNLKKFR